MDFTKINPTLLREVLKLSERKEVLLHELRKIETQILSSLGCSSNSSIITKKGKKNPLAQMKNSTPRAERGSMKKEIIAALTEAGPLGMRISDLAQKINAKNANVHVWFSSTGKKLPEIERIGAGHFRIRQNS